ncbi:hypothetical protein RFI_01433 [Reticulomyxa filosa]|uniref:Uncharacterized protein n=1 Tax=Reticulomyxa filosa TaxID=46433 RepID=X6PBY4_RETFI|nr:hypothetical protein RFI_01433 [Reticulomyxa filosa]|eukprot:ETO35628.1 hypothetical protein RFI_01433 [Reticulomyxa filosa]
MDQRQQLKRMCEELDNTKPIKDFGEMNFSVKLGDTYLLLINDVKSTNVHKLYVRMDFELKAYYFNTKIVEWEHMFGHVSECTQYLIFAEASHQYQFGPCNDQIDSKVARTNSRLITNIYFFLLKKKKWKNICLFCFFFREENKIKDQFGQLADKQEAMLSSMLTTSTHFIENCNELEVHKKELMLKENLIIFTCNTAQLETHIVIIKWYFDVTKTVTICSQAQFVNNKNHNLQFFD